MKAAFSVWDDRIAPVFDVARRIHLVETISGHIVSETREILPDAADAQKAVRLGELGVAVLVCGAISRALQEMLTGSGIRVIPFVAGDLRQVVNAWLTGRRQIELFAMPGCCKLKKRTCTTERVPGEVSRMNGRGGREMGRAGMGTGRGPGGGRMGGPIAAGPAGNCVCPQCGQMETHGVGVLCMQTQCPKCGAAMVRE